MKGIILAGGSGTRLYPLTSITSKQLLPIYDKPMIWYPLSLLMMAKIKDILIITTERDSDNFKKLLGDGSQFGINLYYKIQDKPEGLAQALIIGEEFIGNDTCALALGDNIFYGGGLQKNLLYAKRQAQQGDFATIFGYHVNDPNRFGIVEFDEEKNVISVEEKPTCPKSNYAITGLYFYPKNVAQLAKKVKPSSRGELEITSLNQMLLNENRLKVILLGRGYTWLDTGTFESLSDASNFVRMIQNNTGVKIGVLEEIAYNNNWIDLDQILENYTKYSNSPYGDYLKQIIDQRITY